MQSDTFAKLERDASALAMETIHLKNKIAIKLENITDSFDPSNEFIISYDDEEEVNERYYCEYVNYPSGEHGGKFPYVTLYSEGPSLESVIFYLDEKIKKWKSYFDSMILSNDSIKKSKNGSLFYFKYDKTIIGIKYDDYLLYPNFNFQTLKLYFNCFDHLGFKESFDLVPIDGYDDDASDFNYCMYSSISEMVNEWKHLQKTNDIVSACGSKISRSWDFCEWDKVPKLNPRNTKDVIEQFETVINSLQ